MIDTLKTLLVPGGRSRISPYIQDAQFQILFGESPSAQDRHESLRALLKKHKESVQRLADTYNRFAQSKRQFLPAEYISEDFLRLYLAYYFTTNVCKIQLCLLDHVAANRIPNKLTIVDIGVGTGTTAVAVLDFLLAWTTICHLHSQSFPVEHVEILCYDVSQQCLDIAEKNVLAYCKIILQRSKLFSENSAMSTAFKLISKWGTSTKWIYHDMSDGPIRNSAGNSVFLFASNVLTELTPKGRASLDLSISTMGCGSIANIIEPGDKDSCVGLNTWRNLLLSNHDDLRVISPCETHARASTNPCCSCWNSRRESLHQPPLYSQLRELTHDPRSFDDYLNNLLSWSYTVISNDSRFVSSSRNDDASHLTTKAFGVFRWGKEKQQFFDSALDTDAPEDHCYIDYLKLCPASYPRAAELWARREPGFILPPMPHGTPLRIIGGQVEQSVKKPGIFTLKLTQSTKVVAEILKSNTQSFLDKYNDTARQAIDEIAFRLFGFAAMRSFQHEILGRVLMGHSILGIAATGGGKSECYILPALLFSGVTIVISPLKSLMQDQYEKRIDERYGLKNLTTYINGDVPFIERQARLKRIELGHYKLVYFTPEQLRQSHVLNSLKRSHDSVGIRYLALDEAHCISQWGHDFRDSYLNIVTRLTATGINPVIIALTATASPEVRADLCEELHLINEPLTNGGDVYVYSSNRAELNLIVKPLQSTQDKAEDILSRLQSLLQNNKEADDPDAAIVFMPHTGTAPNDTGWSSTIENESTNRGRFSTRVTSFASYLERTIETRVAIYHGKMDFDTIGPTETNETEKKLGDLSGRNRRNEQTDFIEGKRSIMVATKGFGMGIDKPNIRLIIHRSPTSNLESYAQEAGRAGRDGKISDVILYYSPDETTDDHSKVKRDYDIQDFFLSQKYIRREDVVTMRNFFASKNREINNFVYFTSDEVIPFFNNQEKKGLYTWPIFPPRIARGNESPKHEIILNVGYEYLQKINYIDRILSNMYRIRPNIDITKNFTLLKKVQETGAVINCPGQYPAVCKPDAIVNSNYYFGELLRNKKITPSSLHNWVNRCVDTDIIEFSRFLGHSVAETASMLWDINRSSGQINNGRWKSDLLDFIYIGTPKYGQAKNMSLSQWCEYAGASKRASKPEAQRRAELARKRGEERNEYNGEISPTIDDWFGPKELTKPKGWEVLLGSGVKDDIIFEKYIEGFIDLHDRRKANDRAAYNLLLTDYVGVKENGSLSTSEDSKPCLRAVLLGYLKTGEVVLGNCGSCSRCVPSGQFERDMVKRESIVERLGTEITDLLNNLEKTHSTMPTESQIKMLWRQVEAQEEAGKSFRAYLGGWTGRLLTDKPGHKAALWIRIDGMARGFLPLQPKEACSRAKELLQIVSSNDEIKSILNTLNLLEAILPESLEALEVKALVCEKIGHNEESRDIWMNLLDKTEDLIWKHRCYSHLSKIHIADGPIPDYHLFQTHTIQAARTAENLSKATLFYEQAKSFWSWSDLQEELIVQVENYGEVQGNRLLSWWISLQSGISSLSSSTPPAEWASIIDDSIPLIDDHTGKTSSLKEMTVRALEKWIVEQLNISEKLYAVRAFRIALLTEGLIGSLDDLALESIKILNQANKPLRSWLLYKIETAHVDKSHYLIQFILAEIAFQEGEYSPASEFWLTLIDAPQHSILQSVRIHAICRLIDIFKSSGPLVNETNYNLAVLAYVHESNDWNEAKLLYCEIFKKWDIENIYDEISREDTTTKNWTILLTILWTEKFNYSQRLKTISSILNRLVKDNVKIPHFNLFKKIIIQLQKIKNENGELLAPHKLKQILEAEKNDVYADIYIAVLRVLIKNSNPVWRAPQELLAKALIDAERKNAAKKGINAKDNISKTTENVFKSQSNQLKEKYNKISVYDIMIEELTNIYAQLWFHKH